MHVTPQALQQAARDLAGIGDVISDTNHAVAATTTTIAAAGTDEISTAIADLFNVHGQIWQEVAAQAQNLHAQFVNLLEEASLRYQAGEADAARKLLPPPTDLRSAPTPQYPDGQFLGLSGPTPLTPVGEGEDLFHIYWGGSLWP